MAPTRTLLRPLPSEDSPAQSPDRSALLTRLRHALEGSSPSPSPSSSPDSPYGGKYGQCGGKYGLQEGRYVLTESEAPSPSSPSSSRGASRWARRLRTQPAASPATSSPHGSPAPLASPEPSLGNSSASGSIRCCDVPTHSPLAPPSPGTPPRSKSIRHRHGDGSLTSSPLATPRPQPPSRRGSLRHCDSPSAMSATSPSHRSSTSLSSIRHGENTDAMPATQPSHRSSPGLNSIRHCDSPIAMPSPQLNRQSRQNSGSSECSFMGSPQICRPGSSQWANISPLPAKYLFKTLKVEALLGEGRFGTVWRCVDPKSGALYACKQVDKMKNPKSLRREIECLSQVQGHPGVLRLEGVYESELYLYLVTELCDLGDLFDYLSKSGPLREGQAGALFRQLALAMHHCHSRGIMHRDIKPENILLKCCPATGQISARLADFGLGKRLAPGEVTVGWVGSEPYEAPEVIALKPYDFSADVFSLGVLLFGIISGTWPTFLDGRVFDAESEFAWPGWRRISTEAKELLVSMLSPDARLRPTMDQILTSSWLTQGETSTEASPEEIVRQSTGPCARSQQECVELPQSSPQHCAQVQQQCLEAPQANLRERTAQCLYEKQESHCCSEQQVETSRRPIDERCLRGTRSQLLPLAMGRALGHSQGSNTESDGKASVGPAPQQNGMTSGRHAAPLVSEGSLSDVSWAGSALSSPRSWCEVGSLSTDLAKDLVK